MYQYMNKNGVIARNILTKPDAQDHVHNHRATISSSRSGNKLKARYGGSNMKKINNGCRLFISCMMEGIKQVNFKCGIL